MTWKELKEKAKKMGAAMWANSKTFSIFGFLFYENGDICIKTSYWDNKHHKWIDSEKIVAIDRTYDQMNQIMEALTNERKNC